MKQYLLIVGSVAVFGCSALEPEGSSQIDQSLLGFEPFLGGWQDETAGRRLVLERSGADEVRVCYFERLDERWTAQLMGGVSAENGHAVGSLRSSADPETPIQLTAYPVEGGELDWHIVFGSGDIAATMRQTWSAPASGQFTVVSEAETPEGGEAPIVSTLWVELNDDGFDCQSDGR